MLGPRLRRTQISLRRRPSLGISEPTRLVSPETDLGVMRRQSFLFVNEIGQFASLVGGEDSLVILLAELVQALYRG